MFVINAILLDSINFFINPIETFKWGDVEKYTKIIKNEAYVLLEEKSELNW